MVRYGQMRRSTILATVLETANENLREIACAMLNSEPEKITDTFATEGEAWRWIKNESLAWLNERKKIA